MDDAQKQRAEQWMAKHWNARRCVACGTADQWRVYPRLGQIPNLTDDHTVPVLLVGCGACGYVFSVNAIDSGILTPDDINAIVESPRRMF
jgi:ferredoxin